MRPTRLGYLLLCLVASLALAACGSAQHPTQATSDNNGFYVHAGSVTYQLQISRELNPFATEDRQYLVGLPRGTKAPGADQLWYGVFLWAKNEGKQDQLTAERFDIVDTQLNRYYPVKLDPSVNQYAWTQETLAPLGVEPGPSTTASQGPTQGGLLLFKLNNTVYANRPLTLEIFAPGTTKPSTISLDL